MSEQPDLEAAGQGGSPWKVSENPFRCFKTSPEIFQLCVLMYVCFPLSLRNVEGLVHEQGIDVGHGNIRLWGDRFRTYFADKICKRSFEAMRRI